MKFILPCLYFGPIQYYSKLASGAECILEQHEHFVKQSYRNRAVIFDSNGALKLIIPLQRHAEKTNIRDIRISYDAPWQDLHWKSLESAYRSSPYFEYFEDDFAPFYKGRQFTHLFDYNLAIQEVVLSLMRLKPRISLTERYEKTYPDAGDFRMLISPKKDPGLDAAFQVRPYPQVFEPKYGFLPNLSIADLLFNEGPDSINYL